MVKSTRRKAVEKVQNINGSEEDTAVEPNGDHCQDRSKVNKRLQNKSSWPKASASKQNRCKGQKSSKDKNLEVKKEPEQSETEESDTNVERAQFQEGDDIVDMAIINDDFNSKDNE